LTDSSLKSCKNKMVNFNLRAGGKLEFEFAASPLSAGIISKNKFFIFITRASEKSFFANTVRQN